MYDMYVGPISHNCLPGHVRQLLRACSRGMRHYEIIWTAMTQRTVHHRSHFASCTGYIPPTKQGPIIDCALWVTCGETHVDARDRVKPAGRKNPIVSHGIRQACMHACVRSEPTKQSRSICIPLETNNVNLMEYCLNAVQPGRLVRLSDYRVGRCSVGPLRGNTRALENPFSFAISSSDHHRVGRQMHVVNCPYVAGRP